MFRELVAALCRSQTGTAVSSSAACCDLSPFMLAEAEPASSALECVALAFVHSFDMRQGELLVHVPNVVLPRLECVNVVIRGDINWDPSSGHGSTPKFLYTAVSVFSFEEA